ncbi:MAG: methyltransferase domain-containing protein [Deltaproteobacteria bacterium]|nr:methyltransferase domain-containing protein [Deltaproteobacteria bacterium]
MKPLGARERWDTRYSTEEYLFGEEPSSLLTEATFPAEGQALDIGCGEGQNAVYLAQQGLEVVAVDISVVGLRKARRLAAARGVEIRELLSDIELAGIPKGPFDVIVCIHYAQRELAAQIVDALSPGGLLLMELHTLENLKHSPTPSRTHLINTNELITWFPQLFIESYREISDEHKAVAQLVARKGR